MSFFAVEHLDAHHGQLNAVRDISLQLDQGETVALVGANGAGKTTLLRTLAGAHPASGGRVIFDGRDITRLPAYERVRLGMALVPEGRRLFPDLSVEDNLRLAGARGRPGPWTIERVFETFPMLTARRRNKASTLSGGEQQATAIGRALMSNPRLLLLDEVSLGLAPVAVDAVYAALRGLIATGTTILLVEQDMGRARSVAQRMLCMLEGRLVLEGAAATLTREQITAAYFGLHRAGVG